MAKVRFYPFNQDTLNFGVEPTPASKSMPKWYKQQPSYSGNEEEYLKNGASSSTIKRCMPIFDAMSGGYMLYFPCDIYIDTTVSEDTINWSVPQNLKYMKRDLVSTHTPEQVSAYPIDREKYHKQVFRVLPFWAVGTESGYSCLFTQPIHRDPLPFKLFSGVIDTDKFVSDGHLSMLIEKDFKGVIEKGTPLAQVIPFKRESFEMQLVDVETSIKVVSKQRLSIRSKFKNAYRDLLRQKKEYR